MFAELVEFKENCQIKQPLIYNIVINYKQIQGKCQIKQMPNNIIFWCLLYKMMYNVSRKHKLLLKQWSQWTQDEMSIFIPFRSPKSPVHLVKNRARPDISG